LGRSDLKERTPGTSLEKERHWQEERRNSLPVGKHELYRELNVRLEGARREKKEDYYVQRKAQRFL